MPILQLNTTFRLVSKKFLLWYVTLTAIVFSTLKSKGSRYMSVFTLDGTTYTCVTGYSLGGEIVINKASDHVISYFSLHLNYGTANVKVLDFQWKSGQDRLVIPVFFPQLADSQSGAYAPTVAGLGVSLALTGIPASVSISYSDRSHEILAGKYDPIEELCKLCPNITADWD